MKKKRKGTWKQPVASVLGMGLVVGLTIVGTLAFMYTKSNTKTNVFTGTNDIKLYLEEPTYNLRQNADGTYIVKNTKSPDPREYVPGIVYPKDPTLYNITGKQLKKSDGISEEYAEEWVAMRVDYGIDVKGDGDKVISSDTSDNEIKTCEEMSADYTGDGNSQTKMGIIKPIVFDVDRAVVDADGDTTNVEGGWIKVPEAMLKTDAKYDIYVYKYKLKADEDVTVGTSDNLAKIESKLNTNAKERSVTTSSDTTTVTLGSKTSPLFEEIEIKDQDTLIKNGYAIDDLRFFSIELSGAAIKVMSTDTLTEIKKDEIVPGADTKSASTLIVEDLVSLLQQ